MMMMEENNHTCAQHHNHFQAPLKPQNQTLKLSYVVETSFNPFQKLTPNPLIFPRKAPPKTAP